jgi:hypothetical protein
MSDNIGALTVGAVQHLDDHYASPAWGCFGSSHVGVNHSTSTPLKHLLEKINSRTLKSDPLKHRREVKKD